MKFNTIDYQMSFYILYSFLYHIDMYMYIENMIIIYAKCPKISNSTKVSDKMTNANSADLDQAAPSGAVWSGSTMLAIPLSILSHRCIKSKI